MFMKPIQVVHLPVVSHLNAVLPGKTNNLPRVKKLRAAPPPPDEETISRLNEKAKEYPFCIYYREKPNDPL